MACTVQERNKRIEENIELANKIAERKKLKTANRIRLDEIKSAAYYGLLQAADNYDGNRISEATGRPVSFSTFATHRIVGQINDYLRELSWFKKKQVSVKSLDTPMFEHSESGKSVSLRNTLTVEDKNPMRLEEFFLKLTKCVPSKIRDIMKLYYIDGWTMKEIADSQNKSESRISQIITQYRKIIKEIWEDRKEDLLVELSSESNCSHRMIKELVE